MSEHLVDMRAFFVASGLFLVGLVSAHSFLLDGVDGALLAIVYGEDTVYSARYSDAGFRAVSAGMSLEEVRQVLGEPLRTYSPEIPGAVGWTFAESARKNNYRIRTVLFGNDGRVTSKFAGYWID